MLRRPQNHPLGVCTYYHFYPSQRERDLYRVFYGIMNDKIEDIWTWKDILIGYLWNLIK